jgi:hypothetical protein
VSNPYKVAYPKRTPPINVTTSGNRWELNGRKTGMMLRWAPAVSQSLGQGRKSAVREYFRRTKEYSFDGVSVPLETRNGGPFDTKSNLWDYGALRNGHRPTGLTRPMQRMLFNLIELLQETGLVANVIWNYTLSDDPEIVAGTVGHCFRQLARWFQAVESGEWDREDEGIPDALLAEEYKHLLGKPVNVFVTLHHKTQLTGGLTLNGPIRDWVDDKGREKHGDSLQTQFNRLRDYWHGHPIQWPSAVVGTGPNRSNTLRQRNMDFRTPYLWDGQGVPGLPTLVPYIDATAVGEDELFIFDRANNNGIAFVLDDGVYRNTDAQSELEDLLIPPDVEDPPDEPDDDDVLLRVIYALLKDYFKSA